MRARPSCKKTRSKADDPPLCNLSVSFSEVSIFRLPHVVRKPLRVLAVLLLLLLLLLMLMLLESNFITRDRLDLGENFKKHLTPLIFMNFWKFFENFSKIFRKIFEKISKQFQKNFQKIPKKFQKISKKFQKVFKNVSINFRIFLLSSLTDINLLLWGSLVEDVVLLVTFRFSSNTFNVWNTTIVTISKWFSLDCFFQALPPHSAVVPHSTT